MSFAAGDLFARVVVTFFATLGGPHRLAVQKSSRERALFAGYRDGIKSRVCHKSSSKTMTEGPTNQTNRPFLLELRRPADYERKLFSPDATDAQVVEVDFK
jgi:hypothetical protein